MKKLFKTINIIAAMVVFVFAMLIDTSELSIKVCLITTGYLFLYTYRKDIGKVVYQVVKCSAEVFKELTKE